MGILRGCLRLVIIFVTFITAPVWGPCVIVYCLVREVGEATWGENWFRGGPQ